MSLATKAKTALALGFPNLGRALQYRLGVKLGINPVKKLQADKIAPPFFRDVCFDETVPIANDRFASGICLFGWKDVVLKGCPEWDKSYLTGKKTRKSDQPWYLIPDFDSGLGDIKGVWESSRFDWVIGYAQLAASGQPKYVDTLNNWLTDWVENNAPYQGPNWKCGQEASIRVMHLLIAAKLLGQVETPEKGLITLVKAHLKRIAPTINYAMAQDNNHGTSEAAALHMGGSWLKYLGDSDGHRWMSLGAKWLENRGRRLIALDGSFSQYSMNYHRVMLDTYSMAEVWRQELGVAPFSKMLYERLKAATLWLYEMVQTTSGDAPNLGANDGARLLPLTATDYRDFRPSVQLASALFCNARAWDAAGDWDLPMQWLKVTMPENSLPNQCSFHFEDGGYFGMRASNNRAFAMMTYPKFRFRPSQADALHVDFWLDGENLLRDGGTFSYNAGDDVTAYFGGTAGHNTVQFDRRDQMPRLSRFLFGEWLKTREVMSAISETGDQSCQAGYLDYKKARHIRKVSLSDEILRVEDSISGFSDCAVLRWRLSPGNWVLEGGIATNGIHSLEVSCNVGISRIEIVEGWESRYYYKKGRVPVLEVEIVEPGKLISEYKYQ